MESRDSRAGPGGGAASGAGPGLTYARGARHLEELGGRTDRGPRARKGGRGAAGSGRSAGGAGVDDGVSGLLPPKRAESQDHPRRGWRKRARGGQGAGRVGPRARGLSWPRAPCGRRERPGPAQGGGAGRRESAPCAAAATRKPATWVGRPRGWGAESRPGGPGGAPSPRRCLKGAPRAGGGPEGVYLPPGRAPMPPSFSLHASLPAPRERERGWEWGGGRAGPRSRGPPTFRLAKPEGPRCGGGGRSGGPAAAAASPARRGFPRRRGWQRSAALRSRRRGPCPAAGSRGLRAPQCAHSGQVED